MTLLCSGVGNDAAEILTSLMALLKYVVVHHDVVPPKLHLVLHIREQTSHLRREVNDVSWLIFVKDGSRRRGVGQIAILDRCVLGARARRGECVRRVVAVMHK